MQPKQLGPYDQLVQYREQLAADLARVEGQVCSQHEVMGCKGAEWFTTQQIIS
jgi:roadblock/LC7 domain-containing protein